MGQKRRRKGVILQERETRKKRKRLFGMPALSPSSSCGVYILTAVRVYFLGIFSRNKALRSFEYPPFDIDNIRRNGAHQKTQVGNTKRGMNN